MSIHVNNITCSREKPVLKKKSDLKYGNSRQRARDNACHPESQADMTASFPIPAGGRKSICLVRRGESPTLETAIALLRASPQLTPVRQRDLISALQRIAKACDLPPSQVFADPQWLRHRLGTLPPTR